MAIRNLSFGRCLSITLMAMVLLSSDLAVGEVLAQQRTCGPPPPAKPERRTGGESLPPLPLPATPLRRSEKKREASPPKLVGKVALGEVKWVDSGGARASYRDWMTDPNDIRNLLSWTNSELGIRYTAEEVELSKFSFDPTALPILYFTGHDDFRLSDTERASLRQYVFDGGTIFCDACCGAEAMEKALRRELAAVFPDRPLKPVPADHPLYDAFYRIGSVELIRDGKRSTAKPPLEHISIGCRAGVIFSPWDLSCGWDNHVHEAGRRVAPGDARKIGANMVTYTLADYSFGRFMAVEKVYHEAAEPTRDQFVFAQAMHGGDWDPQPSAVANLLKYVARNTTLEVQFKRAAVDLRKAEAYQHSVIYLTGHDDFVLADAEVTNLRRFLTAGGLLMASSCCGREDFDQAFRREIKRVLPEAKLETLPAAHALFSIVYPIKEVKTTPLLAQEQPGLKTPAIEGISFEGRLRVIYSKYDLNNGWSESPNPYVRGYVSADAMRLGINAIVYAMTP